MAIKMVREPSETPNINNIDDIVPMRYAYGNQNGYVIGKGNEISNTVNGLNFTVNSGRLVLQGVECDIDAVGVTITIDNIATTRYYVVYLQVNLGTNTASILSTYDTATYPTIDAGDDLTENTTGVARLPLYRFTATSGIISDVNKVVESIKYININSTIKNADGSTDGFIQDDNKVLKVNEEILSKKKLIFDSIVSVSVKMDELDHYFNIMSGIELNKTYELEYTSGAIFHNKFYYKFAFVSNNHEISFISDIYNFSGGSGTYLEILRLKISDGNLLAQSFVTNRDFVPNVSSSSSPYPAITKIYQIIE